MASRSTVKRLGAAILGAGLVLMSALPAAADKPKVEPYDGANEPGMGIYLERDGKVLDNDEDKEGVQAFNASLIGLRLQEGDDSQTAKAYCVELPTPLQDGQPLVEVPWGEHPNPDTKFKENAAKVNWVLQNSYPAIEVKDAYELYGLDPENKRSILIAATQAAVWHFSDGVDLRENDSTTEEEDVHGGTVDDLVFKVYEYLTTKAEDLAEPKPTLSIEPGELTGKAGEKIGPFTVSTTATEAVLTAELPDGVTVVDANGNALPVADPNARAAAAATSNVAEVWVKVDAGVEPGEVEFTVTASAKLRSGRLFVSSDRNLKTQSLIIAKSEVFPVKAKAKAKWVEGTVVTTTTEATTTTAPTTTTTAEAPVTSTTVPAGGGSDDDLANTGASIFVPLLIGIGLLGAGAGALLFLRRKRTA
ncbi:LPXTG-motif cell wall-anchored protein/TQXA domain-containing protein [Saccharothrix texasensis]|uniref:LPXTG-motif cell wall-anchored protein/TQXA domain-containing protein n=2 Tax=Saccharothrix texasensis TaxID=103734 RepID=A0A3N1H9D5_9PSEU|nr:LPXTG-motif cell wall-anchored protein/TQXA domain-containing protein [Saccharothrix texasensis]